jgi:hypothetical protein
MIPTIEQSNGRRMIVFVPEGITDLGSLAHKIRWMALSDHFDILYLALVDNAEKTLSVSRQMATLKAITSESWLKVTVKTTPVGEWEKNIKEIYQPGDVIVCHAEQFVKTGFLKTTPIQDYLGNLLNAPTRLISGFYHPLKAQTKNWIRSFLFWAGCLVVLAVFTLLEIQMDQSTHGSARVIILTILAFFEVGFFWALSGISSD